MYIPDNYDMYSNSEESEERYIRRLPVCSCCGESIQDEYYFDVYGKVICEHCIEDCREAVDDYAS